MYYTYVPTLKIASYQNKQVQHIPYVGTWYHHPRAELGLLFRLWVALDIHLKRLSNFRMLSI